MTALREAREALRQTRERNVQLNAALVRHRKELEATRNELAAALAGLEQARQEQQALRLQAANVLVNGGDRDAAAALADTLATWRRLAAMHSDVHLQLTQYRRDANALLDALGQERDSRARVLLEARLESALRLLQEAETLATGVAAAPGRRPDRATVLAVNDELAVLVLDAGAMHGVRVGSRWRLQGRHGEQLTARVITVRPSLCAAILTEGELKRVTPGAEAQHLRQVAPRDDQEHGPE